jgi:hypothetical protein
MEMMKQLLFFSWMVFTLFTFTSCQPHGLPGLVKAEGVVLYDEMPLEKAQVTLSPTEKNGERRSACGVTDRNGKFSLWTLQPGDGVFPGEYQVAIAKSIVLNPMTEEEKMAYVDQHGVPAEIKTQKAIPDKYFSATTSGLTISISEKGTKEIKF